MRGCAIDRPGRGLRGVAAAGLLLLAWPAAAQEPAGDPTGGALAQPAAAEGRRDRRTPAGAATAGGEAGPSGPLVVERIRTAFVIAPEATVTTVDGELASFAGLSAGWLAEQAFLVGGAAYVLTNGAGGVRMAYGGLVVGVLARAERRIGFGARGLVGLGRARLEPEVFPLVDGRFEGGLIRASETLARFGVRGRPDTTTRGLEMFRRARVPRIEETFFVAEPEIDLLVTLTERLRLDWGLGYRFVNAERGLNDRLRGATGSIALQVSFGG